MVVSLTGSETHETRLLVSLRLLGTWLVIGGFVFTQFVDFTFYKLGDFELSAQKVVAFVTVTLTLILIGHIRIPLPLAVFAGVMILANSVAYVSEADLLSSRLLLANVFVLASFLAATVLYTALIQGKSSFSTLARIWIGFAIVTSILTVGQALGLLPLWAVSEEMLESRMTGVGGLIRGTGLQFDPNYQAFMLVLGIVFVRFYGTGRRRTIFALVIALGILATFSRMGIILALFAWVSAPAIRAWTSSKGLSLAFSKVIAPVVILLILSIGLYLSVPESVQSLLEERVNDVVVAYDYLASGASSSPTNSAEERLLLINTSLRIISENFLFGVGAYKTEEIYAALVGVGKTTHNTVLEELAIGGLWGACAIVAYISSIVGALLQSHKARGEDLNRRSFILSLLFVFGLMAAFLTLNYNNILWLPLALVLAHLKVSRLQHL